MTLKGLLQNFAEKITGKRCEQCKHHNGALCNNPDMFAYKKCINCIFPRGFEKKE